MPHENRSKEIEKEISAKVIAVNVAYPLKGILIIPVCILLIVESIVHEVNPVDSIYLYSRFNCTSSEYDVIMSK